MTTRAQRYGAVVTRRDQVSPHLVRLTLSVPGFESTGILDEWVGLVVPGQFQVRYYTVRSIEGDQVVVDVVVHDEGLVTDWACGDCVGDTPVVTAAQGSFSPPDDAAWLLLVGDLTGYLPDDTDVTWLRPPAEGQSRLAEVVQTIEWPAGDGYFWMAGESAQMRAIRKHLMRERRLPNTAYDVMGYWRAVSSRQLRAVDPGPIWRAGRAAGKSDEQIWVDYDEARGE